MEQLIHATLTVTGERELLAAADERIKTLLIGEAFEGGFEEHHGADALAYDFKVHGGVPFPAFAAASQEFPQLVITAEWVNAAAGRKGRAQLSNGGITEHREEPIALDSAEVRNRRVEVAADGTLQLAFALQRLDAREWAGYVLNHERDALFRITRDGESVTLLATDGAPEWAWRWRLAQAGDAAPREALEPPQALPGELAAALERLAQDFVAEWIWMRAAPAADNAIDIDRYARYGYAVREANVRATRLHRMLGEAGPGQPLLHSTLDAEDAWIGELLRRCW